MMIVLVAYKKFIIVLKKDTYTHTASIASQAILKHNLTDLEDKKRRRFIHVNLNKSASFVMCLKFVQ